MKIEFIKMKFKIALAILVVIFYANIANAQSVTLTSSVSFPVCAGTNVVFTATTSGISSPTYQWYKNSVAISGATSSTYSTTTLINNDQINVTSTPGYTSGSISSSNLIANFDAANYNPTSTRWNDLSTSGNHMDFYTSFNYTTLKTANYSSEGGGSLNVNNNNVYGRTINNTGITGNGAKTMSAWVKFDAADRDWTDIANFGSFAGWAQLFEMFGSRNGSGYQIFLVYSGSVVAGATTIPLNTWAYITISADGPSIKIYVNGVLDGSANQALSTVNSPLYLGNSSSTSNFDNLRGKISTLSLWNSALSAQTILDNYNATKGRYAASAGYTSNIITSSINASPSTPILTVTGDACVNKTTLSTTSGLTAYAWYKDNVAISGATINTYTPSVSGVYQVTVSNGTCSNTSIATTIYTCGRNADGRMTILESSTTLVSADGALNNGKGVDERGFILTKPWSYGTVTSPYTSKIWMDRNLGATQAATGVNDVASYGDLYQWGRATDGGQLRTAPQNSTKLTDISSRSTNSISAQPWTSQADWNSQTGGVWNVQPWNNTDGGVNNPCPNGFRVPTASEWNAELNGMIAAGIVTNSSTATNIATGAYASFLKIPQAGVIEGSGFSGTVLTTKTVFWTTDRLDSFSAKEIRFWPTQGVYQNANWYSFRYSVRCIAK